jgi:hypothetical protein
MMPSRLSSLVAVGVLLAFGPAAASEDPARSWLLRQGYAPPTANRMIACHGYGCARRAVVAMEPAWVERLSAIMRTGKASPAAERKALGEAVRNFFSVVAVRIGGRPDVPRSPPGLSGVQGQMDCLDVTANTTSLLLLLEAHHLLVHHSVRGPQSRGLFLDGRYPHFTAVVTESDTGTNWAIDPWTRAVGQRPDILPLAQWQRAS